jgi:murein DD-endopeptidase MepM/ murein hydrolase activator NlpD
MRRALLPAVAAALLCAPAPALAAAPTGGAEAPATGGGVTFNQVVPGKAKPVRTALSVAPTTVTPGGRAAVFSYRVDGPPSWVLPRLELVGADGKTVVAKLALGRVRTGRRHTFAWSPVAGAPPAGGYRVRLVATDTAGRPLRRAQSAMKRGNVTVAVRAPAPAKPAPTPAPTPVATPVATPVVATPVAAVPLSPGVFPVQGPWTFGGVDARFGAGRTGHVHQGQDVVAASGTPIVAPVAGTVSVIAFQARGAGNYVVLRGADGHDYVFMHLLDGSTAVTKGAPVAAGAPLGLVGATGDASGAHLHFEIWPNGWWAGNGSAPIDPLPQLQAWAASR